MKKKLFVVFCCLAVYMLFAGCISSEEDGGAFSDTGTGAPVQLSGDNPFAGYDRLYIAESDFSLAPLSDEELALYTKDNVCAARFLYSWDSSSDGLTVSLELTDVCFAPDGDFASGTMVSVWDTNRQWELYYETFKAGFSGEPAWYDASSFADRVAARYSWLCEPTAYRVEIGERRDADGHSGAVITVRGVYMEEEPWYRQRGGAFVCGSLRVSCTGLSYGVYRTDDDIYVIYDINTAYLFVQSVFDRDVAICPYTVEYDSESPPGAEYARVYITGLDGELLELRWEPARTVASHLFL